MSSTPDLTPSASDRQAAGADVRKARPNPLTGKAAYASLAFVAFLVIFIGYGFWLGDVFVNADARILDIHQNAALLILGLAVLVGLIAGQFDLSVASMATLTCFLTVGLTVNQHWPFLVAILFCLLAGFLGGLINGFLVVRVRMNAFIATLGTGGIYLGISAVYSKGGQITPGVGSSGQLPSWFAGPHSFGAVSEHVPAAAIWLALAVIVVVGYLALSRRLLAANPSPGSRARLGVGVLAVTALLVWALDLPSWAGEISWTVAFVMALACVLWLLIEFTTFGRYLRATGSNSTAARLAGVNPGRETMRAFVLGGLLAAVAGIVLAANQGAAAPDIASAYLLPAFAAAFLSTVLLSNGRFHVWGTVIGGIFVVWISQGLIVGGLPFTWTQIVEGVVLVSAVALSTTFRRTN